MGVTKETGFTIMPSFNNPAGRLYLILEDFRAEDDKQEVDQAWAAVFAISADDFESQIEIREQLQGLVSLTKQGLLTFPQDEQAVLFRPFPDIQKALSYYTHNAGSIMGEQVSMVQKLLSQSVMDGLWHADKRLAELWPADSDAQLSRETIEEVLASIQGLRADIIASDIPHAMQQMLLSKLNSLAIALRYYRIFGNEGVYEAAAATTGTVAVYQWLERDELAEDSQSASVLKGIVDVTAKLLSITANLMKIAQIAGPKVQEIILQLQSGQ